VTAGKLIFLNVWGNILFGYVGIREGIGGWTLQNLTKLLGEIHADPTFLDRGNTAERQMGIDMAKYRPTSGSMKVIN
jgi:hypothetical protein